MLISGRSDVGQMRPVNEDCFWYNDRLLVVADGMGGHRAGEVAAQMAVDTVKHFPFPKTWDKIDILSQCMDQSIQKANKAVYDAAVSDIHLSGMGTTMTMALLVDDQAIFGHVGDSRAYIFRSGELIQVTLDHSVAAELARIGGISQQSAATHPQRHMLTRALGAQRDVEHDTYVINLQRGDGILLCTDGLTNVLSDLEIAMIIARHDHPQKAIDELILETNARGAPDNVTAIFAWDSC